MLIRIKPCEISTLLILAETVKLAVSVLGVASIFLFGINGHAYTDPSA